MARQASMSLISLTFSGDVMFLLRKYRAPHHAARVNHFSS